MNPPQKAHKEIRPYIIAALVGFSVVLSILFVLSPEASSQRFIEKDPPKPSLEAGSGAETHKGPKKTRYDFRLSNSNTFYQILSVLNTPGAEIDAIARVSRPVYDLKKLKKGSVLRVYTLDEKVESVEYKFNDFSVLTVERDASSKEGFKAVKTELPHEVKEVRITGSIENSLFEDGIKAGADPQVIMTLTDIFAWDVDFASDIKKGDTFSILAEVLYVEGSPVSAGRVLGAEMYNEGKRYTAIYFEGADGGSYYDESGKSLRRSLLKSPLRFRRITSHFSKGRFHPILKRYRPHHGIDYGAPTGTPVESAGSGSIAFAGWKGGYGNFIEVRHNNGYSTAYGHLSRIAKGIRTGSKIKQGDVIGFVGSTGISTGPHLHYEVRQGKALLNPLSIKAVADKSISKKEMGRFLSAKGQVTAKLSGTVAVASATSAERQLPLKEHPLTHSPAL